jgi:hypothetical protein
MERSAWSTCIDSGMNAQAWDAMQWGGMGTAVQVAQTHLRRHRLRMATRTA